MSLGIMRRTRNNTKAIGTRVYYVRREKVMHMYLQRCKGTMKFALSELRNLQKRLLQL